MTLSFRSEIYLDFIEMFCSGGEQNIFGFHRTRKECNKVSSVYFICEYQTSDRLLTWDIKIDMLVFATAFYVVLV